MPGVESVATTVPIVIGWSATFVAEGREQDPDGASSAELLKVSPRYFATLRQPVLAGRAFTADDRATSPPVAIVDERLAAAVWPGTSPIGKRLRLGSDPPEAPWREVVGVVAHTASRGVQHDSRVQFYLPLEQEPQSNAWVVIRAAGDPGDVARSVERTVAEIDPQAVIDEVMTMDERLRVDSSSERLTTTLLGVFAVLTLGLASLGIHSLLAHAVTDRQQEICVRMALGASPGQVLALVLRQGLRWVAAGLVLGLGLTALCAPFLAGQLYGLSPYDPATWILLPLAVLGVAVLASLWPAWRASRLRPGLRLP